MVWVALGTGVRISELCGLWPEDLHELDLQLSVVRQVAPGGMVTTSLKTENPRVLPIPQWVADILKRRIRDGKVGPRQPIFPHQCENEDRVYHDRNPAGIRLNRVVSILGMRTITFHDFRHYYASMMIAQGASVPEVQAALGHKKASTTLDTYTHLWTNHEERTRAAAGVAVDLVRAACGQKVDGAPKNEITERRQGMPGAATSSAASPYGSA